jgi:SAM-dependent methyltransferase
MRNSLLSRVYGSILRNGILYTFKKLYHNLLSLFFDFKYGTKTYKRISLQKLNIPFETKEKGFYHVPTQPKSFKKVLTKIEINDDDVFVDFGSGLGRVLIMAAQLNIKNIVGVEFSHELCELAEKNITRYYRKRTKNANINIVCTDATLFPINNDYTIFYFFHPFNEEIFEKVLNNICNSYLSKTRILHIIYHGSNLTNIVNLCETQGIFYETKIIDIYDLKYGIFSTKPK